MQRIFSTIGQAFGKQIVLFGLVSLLSLSSVFIFANQPALANKPFNSPSKSEETIDRAYSIREGVGIQEEDRQATYEEETEAVNKPKAKGIEKIYEKDLKEFKKENPEAAGGLVEGAKDIVDKVTGKE